MNTRRESRSVVNKTTVEKTVLTSRYFELRPGSPTYDPYMRNPIFRGQPDSFTQQNAMALRQISGASINNEGSTVIPPPIEGASLPPKAALPADGSQVTDFSQACRLACSACCRSTIRGGRETRDGGRKEAWTLRETNYASVAFKTNKAGTIVWVNAFVRPGREVLFAKFGDVAKATTLTKSQPIWNVSSASGGYRLVAKEAEGKASVVYLLSLDFPEIQ